jgi:polyferredoxin
MKQKVRRSIILISFFLFPVTMFYFSPYLIIMAGIGGIVAGSAIMFAAQFALSLFLGRAFCGWVCPAGGVQDACAIANRKPLRSKKAGWVKYFIWAPWVVTVILMFVRAGGIKGIDPFFGTEYGISAARPEAYIIYIPILALIVIPALFFRRRLFCHSICWMAPFMVLGRKLGNLLHIPSLRLRPDQSKCTSCLTCEGACPMSLPVSAMVARGDMENTECVLCGECTSACRQNVIRFGFGQRRKT